MTTQTTRPATDAASPRTSEGWVLPSLDDPVVRTASTALGGPAGRRLRPVRRWWTPVRVCLLVAALVVVVFSVGAKHSCPAGGWSQNVNYFHLCYSDAPALYSARGLDRGVVPYLTSAATLAQKGVESPVEYPVLTGLLMWVEAHLFPKGGKDPATTFYDVNVIVEAAFLLGTVVLTALTARRRPWDAMLVALCPAAALTLTINWDMLAVVLLAGAMYAWARERPALAGVLLGLGTAAKLYPVLLLLPLLCLGWRTGKLRPVAEAAGWAALAWVNVNIIFIVANFDGWFEFYRLSQQRPAGFSSIWYLLQLHGNGLTPLNPWASGLTLVLLGAVAGLALLAPRRPRFAQLAFLVVAAFLLANKVYSPQYLLWLVPLAALARPRWRDFWIWQAGELLHFAGIWLYLGQYANANRALGDTAYTWTVLAHIAGTLWLAGVIVRDVLDPALDPVRADGIDDDPTGGVFDGAPDVRRLAGAPA
ncbi:putative membrane protein [Motilibacter rhizosphaerae]|uniref:Putative membrane protein n=1 Tax=Motilibacter rhizosphaerae TaxID=598652 RepID=A0A4Q7NVG7_9ACTN|nr:glycosyltransferase 87 family protein [Motilibacter rhizosphaerae]RZS91177.1 putative membrane protein [Motilibacter rhizosphaerae]